MNAAKHKIWMEPEPIRKRFKQLINEEIMGWFRAELGERCTPPKLTYGLEVVIMNQNVPELSATSLYF